MAPPNKASEASKASEVSKASAASAASASGTALAGVLVVDKPIGITSMDAVAAVRRRAGGARTGHAGTLDPLASGVLVMGLGSATRDLARFMGTEKRYRTVVDLSAFTSTDDREGQRVEVAASAPDEAVLRRALDRLTGEIMQRPPAHSAVNVGGTRSYKRARRGDASRPPPRPVVVGAIEIVRYEWPEVELEIRCGKGTYIRSLARDLGEALGSGGHCVHLRRTAVGPFTDLEAVPLDALPERLGPEDLLPSADALRRLEPAVP